MLKFFFTFILPLIQRHSCIFVCSAGFSNRHRGSSQAGSAGTRVHVRTSAGWSLLYLIRSVDAGWVWVWLYRQVKTLQLNSHCKADGCHMFLCWFSLSCRNPGAGDKFSWFFFSHTSLLPSFSWFVFFNFVDIIVFLSTFSDLSLTCFFL